MPVTVVVTYSCGGCSATATAPEQVIRSEFVSLSGQSHGIGRQRQEPPRIASLAPEGWVAFDPWTGCTYCAACWASIMGEVGQDEPAKTDELRCPSCESPAPGLHPSISGGGEVTRLCPDSFHDPAKAER